jgi:hypothetical protein
MGKLKDKLFKQIDNYISNFIIDKLNKYIINDQEINYQEINVQATNVQENNVQTTNVQATNDQATNVQATNVQATNNQATNVQENNQQDSNSNITLTNDDSFFADFEIDKDVDLTLDIIIIEDNLIKECSSIYKIINDTLNTIIININNNIIENSSDKIYIISILYDILVNSTLKSIELNLVPKNRVYMQHRILLEHKKYISNASFILMILINKINYQEYKNFSFILNDINYLNKNIQELQNKLENLFNIICNYIETTDDILLNHNDLMTKDISKIYKNSLHLVKNTYSIVNETTNNLSLIQNKDRSIDLLTSNKYKEDPSNEQLNHHVDNSLKSLKNCKNEVSKFINYNTVDPGDLAEIVSNAELAMNYALPCVQQSAISLLSSSLNIQIENNINYKDKDFMFEDNIHHTNLKKCLNTLDKIYNFGL